MDGSDGLTAVLGLGLLAATAMASGADQSVCLAPQSPALGLTAEMIREYRAEIRDEFERYFSEASAYLICIDDERARVLTEARAASTTFATILAKGTFP